MHKTAQAWFAGGPSSSNGDDLQKSSSSLLADWNAYAASKESEDSDLSFDLEAAVRTANDKVTGTFSVVSKGVRDLPGNFQSATSNVPSGKSLMYFGLLLATGAFFIFIAFTMFLPVMVLMPQKFAICFTIGCALIIGSFFALKGPKNQFEHMSSKERLPFTLGFLGTMVGTVYVSMVLHSYILSVLFSVLQVLALSYYAISYFPGGSTGLKFLSSALTSSVLKCFGR
ncbi:protein transport protein SFT2-like [Actinidia eriantha]|uniref:Vesicle transport protein n=1 Tax=Actinidia rufa TaxID=165716 RepID=A0A7J0FG47_9ERIC|nr:protein transport protein SFT2-like [Actinidia eriantha]GFY97672.1 Got1/Sft2-like vescicle transport protein family [Actinidia rufa]